jgi:hypothetical protein
VAEKGKNMTWIKKMINELQDVQDFLEIDYVDDDPNMVVERGNALQAYMARTGKIVADAKRELNTAMQAELYQILQTYKGSSHTAVNKLVKAVCPDEQYIVDWAERLNRACVHQLDWCRTVVSKAKEEMRMAAYGGGGA